MGTNVEAVIAVGGGITIVASERERVGKETLKRSRVCCEASKVCCTRERPIWNV
jgi:hypothetical protein